MKTWNGIVIVVLFAVISLSSIEATQPPQEPQPALEAMHPAHRALYFAVRRGTEWLIQAQQPNGLFHQGYQVAFNTPLEPAHYYHQAEAVVALAKVSRLTANPRYHACSQRAMLTLLASTKVDPQDGKIRYTAFPELIVNRLGSAGLLMRAVHEMPVPVEIRLKEADGLAQFVKTMQSTSGLLDQAGSGVVQASASKLPENTLRLDEALALEGLAISMNYSPAPWKAEVLQKAVKAYEQERKQLPMTSYPHFMTCFAETYFRTKDQACAVAVFNMADALCNVQRQAEAGKIAWAGGFCLDGNGSMVSPGTGETARCVSALCDAYRVARQMSDQARIEKYRLAAAGGVQFIAAQQFTGSGVEHFAESYQTKVLGAFRSSPTEGVIRLQDTSECVLAMATYLSDVCGVSLSPVQAPPIKP